MCLPQSELAAELPLDTTWQSGLGANGEAGGAKDKPRELVKKLEQEARDLRRALRQEFRSVLDRVAKRKQYKPSLEPVEPEDCPDYYDVIKRGMDLGEISAKVASSHARTAARTYTEPPFAARATGVCWSEQLLGRRTTRGATTPSRLSWRMPS